MLLVILGISIGLFILGGCLYDNTNLETTGTALGVVRFNSIINIWTNVNIYAYMLSL